MTRITDFELKLYTRRDGSDILGIGNPKQGPHEQFDFYGSHKMAEEIVYRFNSHASLVEENKRLRELLERCARGFELTIKSRDFAYVSGTDLLEEISEALGDTNA